MADWRKQEEVESIKGYIKGSIKDMQSLLEGVENNIPVEEEKFDQVKDDRLSLRCNFRKVCKPLLKGYNLHSDSH